MASSIQNSFRGHSVSVVLLVSNEVCHPLITCRMKNHHKHSPLPHNLTYDVKFPEDIQTHVFPYCNQGRGVQSLDWSHIVLQLPKIRPWSYAQGVPRKGQYSIDLDMLQTQVGGRRGTSFFKLSRLQKRKPQTEPKTTMGRVFSLWKRLTLA
jgi:hypothetical protein